MKTKNQKVKVQKPQLNRLQSENIKKLRKTKDSLINLSNKINVLENELTLLKNEKESLTLKLDYLNKVKDIVNKKLN